MGCLGRNWLNKLWVSKKDDRLQLISASKYIGTTINKSYHLIFTRINILES